MVAVDCADATGCISTSTCEPFTTSEDLLVCCPDAAEVDPTRLEDIIQAASDAVSRLLANQFVGVCCSTAYPCPSCDCGCGARWEPRTTSLWWPLGGDCCCGPYPKIDLGPAVVEVVSVVYEGVAVDPATYRVDDARWLVRLDDGSGNPGWPRPVRQAAPDGGEGSLRVTWRHGFCVPPLVKLAVEAVACQLVAACGGGDCALPANVTQLAQQGATISFGQLQDSALAQVLGGLPPVAMAVDAYNPMGWRAVPSISDPNRRPPARFPQ
jgi:hypothetical protein